MTSRNKPGKSDGLSEHEQTMHQVWHGVIDTLRLLPTIPPSSTKPTTEDERQKDLRQTLNEKKHLDEALEKLNLLISLRNNNDGQLSSQGNPPVSVASTGATSVPIATVNGASGSAVPIPIVSISTPTPSLSSLPGGGVKRKRKNSISASPAPMMPPNSADSALTSIASPLPTSATLKSATRDITPGRGGTPGNRELTGKQKKELYHDQLPLQPGRRVAAKPPPKTTATGAGGGGRTGSSGDISMSESGVGSGGDEEWILATIKKCIQGDKMRYEVQDADDVNITWNTTLRSIIPLPDASAPTHLSSHPSNLEDFPKGSQVLALYPDTTSFYRATVMSAPIPGTGNGLGVKGGSGRPDPGAKKEKYRLAFVDDGDNIHDVHKSVVVMASQAAPICARHELMWV